MEFFIHGFPDSEASIWYFIATYRCSDEGAYFLWQDGTLHYRTTGYTQNGVDVGFDKAPGYWPTEKEAQEFLDAWRATPQSAVEMFNMVLTGA